MGELSLSTDGKSVKFILIIFLVIGVSLGVYANHTKGGWMYYKYIGPGNLPNTARYIITLKIYTECTLTSAQWCPEVNISIFNAGNNSLFEVVKVTNTAVTDIQNCSLQSCHPCMSDIPIICYKIASFEFTKELPITQHGYIISYQRCCRIDNIVNMVPGSVTIGDTWTVSIPGNGGNDPLAYKNSSALFSQNDTTIVCKSNYFTFDFSAVDIDNDSLVYSFSDAYFASSGNGTQCENRSDFPPFSSVIYLPPFSGSHPLGPGVDINSSTGIVAGVAPSIRGTYVVGCTVREYKRGTDILKSSVHKSMHINITDCSITQAVLSPEYFSCKGYTRSFSNAVSSGNIESYHWDFGVAGTEKDTANIANPTFTYPDTGTYILKLWVNKNLACADSAFSIVKVYPVFLPDFLVQGQCKFSPIQFFDNSITSYGMVNLWEWDFGEGGLSTNYSSFQNPLHQYLANGSYLVSLKISTDKGCRDTITKTVKVTDKPLFNLSNDTVICVIDTLQLKAIGQGTILWSPNYNINLPNSFSPLVCPAVPTKYFATVSDPFGCSGTDSVFVDVKRSVTLIVGNDTTICQSDSVKLSLLGDAVQYKWTQNSAVNSLNNPLLKNPIARPLANTIYQVKGNIGKCFAEGDIAVKVIPYPKTIVSADTIVCFGNSVQLKASGGSFYSWDPSNYLNNQQIANPISIEPSINVRYWVSVTDTLGCPKPTTQSILVSVVKIIADAGPADTAIVLNQPLQLTASGGEYFQWSHSEWLSNYLISNPKAIPLKDVVFVVKVKNIFGCSAYDSIQVRVFRFTPGIFVPTAFTPNGDGRNDFFRPVSIGLKSLDRFTVYNRWGQLLYSNTNLKQDGWDGTFKGSKQEQATYVWYAEGIDYLNTKLKRKGYVVLVR